MNYYLAFIRELGKSNGYYELVKANSKPEAYLKVHKKIGEGYVVDISDTIE